MSESNIRKYVYIYIYIMKIVKCDEYENKEAIKIMRNQVSWLSLGFGTRN